MGDQSTLIYSQPDGRAEGEGEEEKMGMGLRDRGIEGVGKLWK